MPAQNATFADLAKAHRIRLGVTLRELAPRLGLQVSQLSRLECDLAGPELGADFLGRWMAVLGLDAAERVIFVHAARESALRVRPTPTEAEVDAHMPIFTKCSPEKLARLRPLVRAAITPGGVEGPAKMVAGPYWLCWTNNCRGSADSGLYILHACREEGSRGRALCGCRIQEVGERVAGNNQPGCMRCLRLLK